MNKETRKEGLYLCKVRGLRYVRYMLLMWDEQCGWFQYFEYYTNERLKIEGWCGLDTGIEVESVVQFVDEVVDLRNNEG